MDIDQASAAQALESLQQGTYATEGSLLDFLTYDRISTLSTTLAHTMFQAPVGQGGRTLADTNMVQAGVVPQGQHWKIYALRLSVLAPVVVDEDVMLAINAMLSETTMNFVINNKATQYQTPLMEFLGMSLGVAPVLTQAAGSFPVVKGVIPLNRQLVLAALTPFRVEINHWTAPDASIDGTKIRIGLITDLTRAGS